MKRSAVGESGLVLGERDWYTMGADASPTLEPIEHKPPSKGRGDASRNDPTGLANLS
jgi:hypothetical protein